MAIVVLAPRVGHALAILAVTACMTGCAGSRKFSAAYLPPELEAPPAYNVGNLDLSKFSGPAASSARIELGDVLEISIAASLDTAGVTKFLARVGDDGTTVLPEIGPCQLAGMETPWAEQHISTLCMERGLYRQPNVTVTVKEQRRNRITVVGAVEEPGIVELPRRSSYLMDAIVAAGGLSGQSGCFGRYHPAGRRHPAGCPTAFSRSTARERSGRPVTDTDLLQPGGSGDATGQARRTCRTER